MDRRRHRSAPTSSRGRPRAARPASPADTAPWACSHRHVASDRDAHRMGQRSMRYFVARPLRQQEGRHENNHCHGPAGRLDNCRTMLPLTAADIISVQTHSVAGVHCGECANCAARSRGCSQTRSEAAGALGRGARAHGTAGWPRCARSFAAGRPRVLAASLQAAGSRRNRQVASE